MKQQKGYDGKIVVTSTASASLLDDIVVDPLNLLLIAIRLDERDEHLLEAPLESVSFCRPKPRVDKNDPPHHDHDDANGNINDTTAVATHPPINPFNDLKKLILILKQYEMMDSSYVGFVSTTLWDIVAALSRQRPRRRTLPPPPLPHFALTPILLSGLVSVILEKEWRENCNNTEHSNNPRPHDDLICLATKSLEQQQQQPSRTRQDGQQQKQQQQQQRQVSQTQLPSASDLVVWCKTMRRSAIRRVRARKRRRKILKYSSIILSMFLFGITSYWILLDFLETLTQLGYLPEQGLITTKLVSSFTTTDVLSTNDDGGGDIMAYRWAEANLWMTLQDFGLRQRHLIRSCTLQHCSTRSSIQEATIVATRQEGPYALHTRILQNLITVDELKRGIPSRLTYQQHQQQQQQQRQQQHFFDDQCATPVSWLGTSTINRLIREYVVKHDIGRGTARCDSRPQSKRELRVLDVGCGIGGTLYSLLPSPSSIIPFSGCGCWDKLNYHGISISTAEIHHAHQLATAHGLVSLNTRKGAVGDGYDDDEEEEEEDDYQNIRNSNLNIQFERTDFNRHDAFPNNQYRVAIAVESLSHSDNITSVLTSLYKSLQPNGMLIVIDDVVATGLEHQQLDAAARKHRMEKLSFISSRPSLLTHKQWKEEFEKVGFIIKEAVDVGLEYDLPELLSVDTLVRRSVKWIGYAFLKPVMERFLQWRRKRIVTLAVQSDARFKNSVSWFRIATFRLFELLYDSLNRTEGMVLRQEAHRQSDLTLNMYICIK